MKRKIIFLISVFIISLCVNFRNVNAEIVSGNKYISDNDISLSSMNGVYYNLVHTTNSSTIIREYNIEFNNMLVDNSHDYIRFILLFYRLGRTVNTEISAGVNCKENGGCWEYDTTTVQYFDNDFTPMVRITYDYSGDHHICTVKNSGFGFLSVDCPLVSEQPHVTKITIRVPGLDNYSVGTILYGVANFANYIDNDSSAIINEQQETNEKLDETNEQLTDLNDNITNSDVSGASSTADSFFSGFEDNSHGLTAIVTAPLNLIQSITSSTCTPIGFEAPFVEQKITLPCMKGIYEKHFGTFLTLYQTITFGVVAYWVCVNILATVRGFKDPDSDKIEVLDL